uniref:Uncharacterized protein n=1 Tax=Arundo donax TaxID=35708 RepID=A0A0A9CCB4_ARUDO
MLPFVGRTSFLFITHGVIICTELYSLTYENHCYKRTLTFCLSFSYKACMYALTYSVCLL